MKKLGNKLLTILGTATLAVGLLALPALAGTTQEQGNGGVGQMQNFMQQTLNPQSAVPASTTETPQNQELGNSPYGYGMMGGFAGPNSNGGYGIMGGYNGTNGYGGYGMMGGYSGTNSSDGYGMMGGYGGTNSNAGYGMMGAW